MEKKEGKKAENIQVIEPILVTKNFKIIKPFVTEKKTYNVGDEFKHNDKKVVNFLKTNKII